LSDPATDSALIAAYRQGDDAALGALIQRYQAQTYRLALGILASDNTLGGYGGGPETKRWLLRLEGYLPAGS